MAHHTLALSINAICTDIYARTAIHHTASTDRPPMLTTAQRPALEQLIRDSFTTIALQLNTSPAATTGDIIALTLPIPDNISPAAIVSALSRHIALSILAEAYSSADPVFANTMQSFAETTLAAAQAAIAPAAMTRLPRITPHPY